MRISVLVLGLVFAAATAASAQTVSRVEISDPGIYRTEIEKTVDAPDTAAGKHHVVRSRKLVERTTRIPALRSTEFGFTYRVIGNPANASVTLRFVTRFPPGGLRNPSTNTVHSFNETTVTATLGRLRIEGYRFDHEWEIVPGTWVFEIWHDEKLLASQAFEVVRR